MTKQLMAAAVLLFATTQTGVALAQSSTPTFQNNASAASRQAGGNQASAELFYMIQQLQGDLRRLQGEVEEQRHLINRLEEQGRDRYIDLDQRVLKLSAAQEQQARAATSAAASSAASAAPAGTKTKDYRQPSAEEREAYNTIVDLVRNQKKYDQAITSIYEFLDTYPEGDLTVNAYYWLGEVYLVKPQLEQAKQAFSIVATRFADHRKAPDSAYKLGVTLDKLGDSEEARRRMQSVVKNYPESGAAKLAQSFLNQQGSGS